MGRDRERERGCWLREVGSFGFGSFVGFERVYAGMVGQGVFWGDLMNQFMFTRIILHRGFILIFY